MEKIVFLVFLVIKGLHALRLNLTNVQNCMDEQVKYELVPIEMLSSSIERDPVDGMSNTFHATYIVRTVNTNDKEFIITSYSCPPNSPQPCLDNPMVYKEDMPCTRFKSDTSGPWYMFYEAMSGSHCGEETGTFELQSAVLKSDYLHSYFSIGVGRYRIKIFAHTVGSSTADLLAFYGCIELDFDIVE